MSDTKQWSKDSYKRAAQRHYHNCQYIFNQLPRITDANYRNHVASDCYYIGGYVMECALKYFVMCKQHMTKNYNLEELEAVRLKTHDLHLLMQVATEGSETIDVDWKQLCKLTKDWSEQVRYDRSFCANETPAVEGSFREDMVKIYETVFKQY